MWQTIGSAAIAIANVIAEALVVEKSSGESQDYASRLQSIIWAGQAVGGIIAAWTGGFILTFMTDKQVFLLVGTFPLKRCAYTFTHMYQMCIFFLLLHRCSCSWAPSH